MSNEIKLLNAIYKLLYNPNLTDSQKVQYAKDYYEVEESNRIAEQKSQMFS